jgi:V8-like Glu-specific endopeptidase
MLKTNLERYNARKSSTTGLDYTLLTLKGNPEATWGELIPTRRDYSTGTQLNFIQHPGGNPKKIGYWEDSAHTVQCKVDTINATYGSAAPGSQLGYGCDSEGGSSGSAITAASDGKVIGLHHYGGVATCLNSGTMMVKICDNAGSLLICE